MKNRIFIFQPILICATIIMFNACFSQWKGEDAVLVINLGRITGNRAALPWPPNGDNGFLDQIVFNVELTGPGGTIHITGKKHGESIRAAVLPGRWSVAVEAFLDSIVYA
ncbi:MAG: hypothetical protein FWH38_08205, partial [Treponema sp.]|nr:hypothetical protein [Treponema sp.]